MYQVMVDKTFSGTVEDLEYQIKGFRFKGPGFYKIETNTVLVIPIGGLVNSKNIWAAIWPNDQVFMAHVWQCPFHETIWGCQEWPPPERT